MPEDLVVFPDAEQIHADYLRTALTALDGYSDVEVFVTPPDTLPARFVTVRRAGGVADTRVTDSPRLSYVAWGSDDTDSHDIAQLARGLFLRRMRGTVQGGVPIYDVTEIGGPVPTVDPESGRHRYLASIQTRLRGAIYA